LRGYIREKRKEDKQYHINKEYEKSAITYNKHAVLTDARKVLRSIRPVLSKGSHLIYKKKWDKLFDLFCSFEFRTHFKTLKKCLGSFRSLELEVKNDLWSDFITSESWNDIVNGWVMSYASFMFLPKELEKSPVLIESAKLEALNSKGVKYGDIDSDGEEIEEKTQEEKEEAKEDKELHKETTKKEKGLLKFLSRKNKK